MEEQLDIIPSDCNTTYVEEPTFSTAPPIEFPEHGGDSLGLESYFTGDQLLDFSVCLNPLGPPKLLTQTIEKATPSIRAYPSPFATPLKKQLASHHNLAPENFLVTHGSTQLIYSLPELWPVSSSVCIIAPCFSEYEKAFAARGIETHYFLLDPAKDFDLQWDQLSRFLKSIPNLGGVVLGHPASPSGTVCEQDVLEKLLHFTRGNNQHLIVDETFIDFTDRGKILPDVLPENPHLILVRSFSKFFSIPGIRLGYGIMSAQIQKRLERLIPPWSIGSIEMEVGATCLGASEYIQRTGRFLATERRRIRDFLNTLSTVSVFPSESCSLLFQLTEGSISPETLFSKLLQDNILIRNCGNFRGLDKQFFRVGVRSEKENNLLIDSFKKIFRVLSE